MNEYSDYVLFHLTPEQLRRIGKRGGKACARNRRARQRALPARIETRVPDPPPVETTAHAMAALDAEFPWLRGVETRRLGKAQPRSR